MIYCITHDFTQNAQNALKTTPGIQDLSPGDGVFWISFPENISGDTVVCSTIAL